MLWSVYLSPLHYPVIWWQSYVDLPLKSGTSGFFPLLKKSENQNTQFLACQFKCVGRILGFFGSSVTSGWDPLMFCLWKEREGWGFKDRKVNVAEIWFPSDGHSLKEICSTVLYGADMMGGSCLPSHVPGTVPSHWSLWKADHTGLRGQNPGQVPLLILSPITSSYS